MRNYTYRFDDDVLLEEHTFLGSFLKVAYRGLGCTSGITTQDIMEMASLMLFADQSQIMFKAPKLELM